MLTCARFLPRLSCTKPLRPSMSSNPSPSSPGSLSVRRLLADAVDRPLALPADLEPGPIESSLPSCEIFANRDRCTNRSSVSITTQKDGANSCNSVRSMRACWMLAQGCGLLSCDVTGKHRRKQKNAVGCRSRTYLHFQHRCTL